MPRVLNQREKIILYVSAGLFTLFIVLNVVIEPIVSRTRALNKEINFGKAKLTKYMQLMNSKESIQSRHKEATSEGDVFVGVLAELERLAKDSNINILDMRPQETKNSDVYKETTIDFRTEGEPADYLKFIYSIENSLALFKVKKIQLTALSNSPDLEGSFSVSHVSLE